MKSGYYIKDERLLRDPRFVSLLGGLAGGGFVLDRVLPGEDLSGGEYGMLLSIGGDGTFLDASRLAAPAGVPILGVNFGRLGFLSGNKPGDVPGKLAAGEYTIEERAMLKIEVDGMDIPCPVALNEVSVCRSGAEMLSVDIRLDGARLPRYWADGIIVSTSSGSTAYSLSVGGPICTPSVKALIVAPVSPHNLNVRPLVVPQGTAVSVNAGSRSGKDLMLSLDNRTFPLPQDREVRISQAPFALKCIRLAESNFIDALRSKLFWGEDVRNME